MAYVYKPLPVYSIADEDCKNCRIGYEEVKMEKEFTKNDLKNRMVVKTRACGYYIVIDGILMRDRSYISLSHYGDDLKLFSQTASLDIVAVYDRIFLLDALVRVNSLELIWERHDIKELTLKEIAEKFGVDEVKIIDA